MKKLLIILMLFVIFSLSAQELDGNWNYTITYENGGIQTGIITFNKSTMTIDNTNHIYSIRDEFLFIGNIGYYYEMKDEVLTLTPAFGGIRHIIQLRRIK